DDEIGSEIRKTNRLRMGEALPVDEREVRPSNGVGIAGQLEPALHIYLPEPGRPRVGDDLGRELAGYPAVPEAGRLAHHQDAPHQLDLPVREVRLQQLVGGHERGSWHASNVRGLGGHGNPNATRA